MKCRLNWSQGKDRLVFDQRDNRIQLQPYAKGRTVLDVFSYAGAWAVHALRYGATAATVIDRSSTAIELAKTNAQRNGFELEAIEGEAVAEMKTMIKAERRFDVVVLDPPALIKRRKDYENGLQSYYQLNRLAIQLVAKSGGLLVSCSCSHHLEEHELVEVIRHGAQIFGRDARILKFGGQSSDHPVHPAMPETRYLKSIFVWIG
ncbi:MAG: class I SAM-dependent methyltransferase [Pirellulaceae bacterium]